MRNRYCHIPKKRHKFGPARKCYRQRFPRGRRGMATLPGRLPDIPRHGTIAKRGIRNWSGLATVPHAAKPIARNGFLEPILLIYLLWSTVMGGVVVFGNFDAARRRWERSLLLLLLFPQNPSALRGIAVRNTEIENRPIKPTLSSSLMPPPPPPTKTISLSLIFLYQQTKSHTDISHPTNNNPFT